MSTISSSPATSPLPLTFHIIPNAHLDPVWLWDWREGLSEGLTTVTTMLDMMDEFPELTFIRGEAAIYQHIQKTSPCTFRRIRAYIEQGRWDVVGGTHIQPDSNLTSTETLCRQFEESLAYFQRELGVRPTIAWQADSFGHTAGWPGILRSFGMEGFTFTRPQEREYHLPSPMFWWDTDFGDPLLCYRQHAPWYCSERANLPEVLDTTLKGCATQPWRNAGVLMGLGNHGGGPSRRHIAELREWAAKHPGVTVKYATLHSFFRALREEELGDAARAAQVPHVQGDLGYCLRGCYSSVQKFKAHYRHAEAAVVSAEITQTLIHNALDGNAAGPAQSLDESWNALLFNAFHDILPGTSIERAMEEQMAWVGLAIHHAHKARFEAMNLLAQHVDTTVPRPADPDAPTPVPLLIWNALPVPFSGPVELETSMDYRPSWAYKDRPAEFPIELRDEAGALLPFQEIQTEHTSMPELAWRKRVVLPLEIPAFGWRVVRFGCAPAKPQFPAAQSDTSAGSLPLADADAPGTARSEYQAAPWIDGGGWGVSVPRVSPGGGTDSASAERIVIEHDSSPFFGPGGLRVRLMDDIYGSWGGMNEEPDSWQLDTLREEWALTHSKVVESGPERATLWTRWSGARSWLDLTFQAARNTPWLVVQGRLLMNERSARLQLVLPSRGDALCDMPGATALRTRRGQLPVGRWFTRHNERGDVVGVASDVLSDADFLPTETRLTLARATRYANDVPTRAEEKMWEPAVDSGELKFRLALFAGAVDPDTVVNALIHPPVAQLVTPGAPAKPALPSPGSLGSLQPAATRLLAARRTEAGGVSVRVQNRTASQADATLTLGGKATPLGKLGAQQIATRTVAAG
ncbi:glycoside hydrolase family 38 [Verrucomicrobia bacterium LW23]|nr:glycoside hydrolase family 38 [Verrucomicrobia bacterium LW23]